MVEAVTNPQVDHADSSAPYPIIITPSGGASSPAVVGYDRLQTNTIDVVGPGVDNVVPNSGVILPAVEWDQRILFTTQAYMFPVGGAGFSLIGATYLASGTGHGVTNVFGVVDFTPGAAPQHFFGTVHGHAVAAVPAGDVSEFDLHVVNNGFATIRVDGTHTGMWCISFPI